MNELNDNRNSNFYFNSISSTNKTEIDRNVTELKTGGSNSLKNKCSNEFKKIISLLETAKNTIIEKLGGKKTITPSTFGKLQRNKHGSNIVLKTVGGKVKVDFEKSRSIEKTESASATTNAGKIAALPKNSFEVFSSWLKTAEQKSPYFKNGITKNARQDYPKTGAEFKEAFDKFSKVFIQHNCNFHKMKHAYQNGGEPKVTKQDMQMLCDMRAAFYEEKYFPQVVAWVKREHNLEMTDPSSGSTGSVEITSDWDPPFKIGENHQTIEAKAVAHFNEIFRQEWGSEAGLVFDTNAYTNQYDRKVEDAALQTELAKVQNKIGLVMSAMTLPEADFKEITNGVASKITHLDDKIQYFDKIKEVKEEKNKLTGRLNKEMLKGAIKLGISLPPELTNMYNANFEKDDNRWCLEENVTQFFEGLEKTDKQAGTDTFEQIKRNAKNTLHEHIKGSYTHMENRRTELSHTIQELKEIKNPEEFRSKFNGEIEKQIQNIERSNNPNPALINKLKESTISKTEAQDLMQDFHQLKENEGKTKNLLKERAGLEAASSQFVHLNTKLTRLTKDLNSPGSKSLQDLQRMSDQHKKLTADISKLENIYGKNGANLKELKTNLEQELNKCYQEKENILATETGQKASVLDYEADRLLVGMEHVQTTGMIFADEAHASADAFKRVVMGIQVGMTTVHSIQAELNAITEIASFGFDHMQKHADSGSSMVANGAKYMDRIFTVLDIVNERADALNIARPQFSEKTNVDGLRTFFTKLAPNRAKGGDELKGITSQLAKEANFTSNGEEFSQALAHEMDRQLKDLCMTLLAWGEQIPREKASALFQGHL